MVFVVCFWPSLRDQNAKDPIHDERPTAAAKIHGQEHDPYTHTHIRTPHSSRFIGKGDKFYGNATTDLDSLCTCDRFQLEVVASPLGTGIAHLDTDFVGLLVSLLENKIHHLANLICRRHDQVVVFITFKPKQSGNAGNNRARHKSYKKRQHQRRWVSNDHDDDARGGRIRGEKDKTKREGDTRTLDSGAVGRDTVGMVGCVSVRKTVRNPSPSVAGSNRLFYICPFAMLILNAVESIGGSFGGVPVMSYLCRF